MSLILPCPEIKVDGKVQKPNSGRTSNDPDPLGMGLSYSSGKEPWPAEVLAEYKGNTE